MCWIISSRVVCLCFSSRCCAVTGNHSQWDRLSPYMTEYRVIHTQERENISVSFETRGGDQLLGKFLNYFLSLSLLLHGLNWHVRDKWECPHDDQRDTT